MKVKGAEIIAMDADKQHLDLIHADKKILLGKEITKGLGCGGDPQKGSEAARATIAEIKKALEGADMVWLLGGLGGGTATGALPVVAKICKEELGIDLVIATVTMPFRMEGTVRLHKAEQGLLQLQEYADNIIVIDNNKLLEIAGNLPLKEAFNFANTLIGNMIKGIVETIAEPSLVNLDFADVKAVMTKGGVSVVGIGESDSENRALEAVKRALQHPLLDVSYEGATGAIVHVTGGADMTLAEVNVIGEYVMQFMGADALIIWGARIVDEMKGRIRVTTIVTGVKSPYILGRRREAVSEDIKQKIKLTDLGIEVI